MRVKSLDGEVDVGGLVEVGVDGARAEHRDLDTAVFAAQLLVDRLCQAHDIVFGGVIGGELGSGGEARHGADIEDHPAVAREHIAEEQLGEDVQRADVGVDQRHLALERHVLEETVGAEARVVDEHVDLLLVQVLVEVIGVLLARKVDGNDAHADA